MAAATGVRNSGEMVAWKRQYEDDQSVFKQLSDDAKSLNKNYELISQAELEIELSNIHRLQSQVNEHIDKYQSEVEADNNGKERIKKRNEPK